MKTIEQRVKAYDEALERARKLYERGTITESLGYVFPELKESEDERIRKELIDYHRSMAAAADDYVHEAWIAWLEKQGKLQPTDKIQVSDELYEHIRNTCACIDDALSSETLTDINDYLSMAERSANSAFDMIEKQGTPAKLSEEEQNRFAKGVLTSCALSFIDYLDAHKYEGKMCVSNGECEDIENAFHNAMWDRLYRYYCKYIEKQGEQKPADKVESKFHEGDWVFIEEIEGYKQGPFQIKYLSKQGYCFDKDRVMPFCTEDLMSLWTIADAKDGDVLASELCDSIILFKGIKDGNIDFYCDYDFSEIDIPGDRFTVNNGQHYGNVEDSKDFHPATKEQRDFLFSKMKEAGYMWDSESKQLLSLKAEPSGEQKPTQETEPFEAKHGKYYYCIKDYFCGGKKQASKGDVIQALRGLPIMGLKDVSEYFLPVNFIKCNSAWSEDDSVRLQRIIDFLWYNRKGDTDTIYQQEQDIDWLKSFKYRIITTKI